MDQSWKSVLGKRLSTSINIRVASGVQTQPFAYSQNRPCPRSLLWVCGTGDLCRGSQCSVTGAHCVCMARAVQPCCSSLHKWLRNVQRRLETSPSLLQVFRSYFLPVSLMLFVSKHCQICWEKNLKNGFVRLITHISIRKSCIMI